MISKREIFLSRRLPVLIFVFATLAFPNVSRAAGTKAITSFSFPALSIPGIIDESAHTITVAVPETANLSSLVPEIVHDGISISPTSGVVQDFGYPVTYTVTADDSTTQEYVVSVSDYPELSSKKAITSFSFPGLSVSGTVVESNHSVFVAVPIGTDITGLVPSIEHEGILVSPASGTAQDFSNPVTYTVIAQDGSVQQYVVNVKVGQSDFLPSVEVSFDKDDVKNGKTEKKRVKIRFKNTEDIVDFMVAGNSDFSGGEWESIAGRDSKSVSVEKKDGTQRFYVRFRDVFGSISETYVKRVEYDPDKRVLKNSASKIPFGRILKQSGKRFSKSSEVDLYFSRLDGTYFPKKVVMTDSKGSFSVEYTVNKPKGTYKWYAIDVKTGKKSKIIKYVVQ